MTGWRKHPAFFLVFVHFSENQIQCNQRWWKFLEKKLRVTVHKKLRVTIHTKLRVTIHKKLRVTIHKKLRGLTVLYLKPHQWCDGLKYCRLWVQSKTMKLVFTVSPQSNDWLARNRNNVSKWSDKSICRLFLVFVLYKADFVSSKCNLFSPWYS